MTAEVRASPEQVQQILVLLGSVEARRRKVDIKELSRQEASDMLRRLTRKQKKARISTGGRPARPISALPQHQQKLITELAANPTDPRHGTQYAYGAGRCKCEMCKRAGRK